MNLCPYKGNSDKAEKIMKENSSKKSLQLACLRMISVLTNN